VDTNNAVVIGGLANKPLFLGSALAEIVSYASWSDAWNGDAAISAYPPSSWYYRGSVAEHGSVAGIFTFVDRPGGIDNWASHRTILSGY
jgi:hypothetical protein